MKLIFLILIVFEVYLIAVAVSSFSPFINYRTMKSAVEAYDVWQKNPTMENETAWLRKKTALKHQQFLGNICVYSLLAINAIGLFVLFRRTQRQTNKG